MGLLATEPDPRARDQYLQQLLNSTLEDTPWRCSSCSISVQVSLLHINICSKKFLHLLTNLVLAYQDDISRFHGKPKKKVKVGAGEHTIKGVITKSRYHPTVFCTITVLSPAAEVGEATRVGARTRNRTPC